MCPPKRDLIFDIGMHVGQDTEFYLKKGFRVIAVEANPGLVEAGQEKFADAIAAKQLTILHAALAHDSGTTDFYICDQVTEWSSLDERLAARGENVRRIKVDTLGYGDLAGRFGTPYYMKIDIEGADLIPIIGLSQATLRPAYVSYEASSLEGAALLFALGYKKFKLVGQRDLPDLAQPKEALEGQSTDHRFALGASGPFGEETPGLWSSFDDCVSDYIVHRHFRRLDRRRKPDWVDIHARSDRFAAHFKKTSNAAVA